MRIGIDFDNTIVCYDRLFHAVALEKGLIPPELPPSKGKIRDYLRQARREDDWTEMQGYVYGPRMAEAEPFRGVLEFLVACLEKEIDICIISHKTRYPYRGHKYDLHASALDWLAKQGVFDAERIGLPRDRAFFELTKRDKLRRIDSTACTHFVDDLPEFLGEDEFPRGVRRMLFDPNGIHGDETRFARFSSWEEIEAFMGIGSATP